MAQNQSPSFLDEALDSWWRDTWAQMIRLREEVHAWWRLVTVWWHIGMFSDSHKKCWHRIWLRDTGHRHGHYSLSGRLSIRCLPAVSTGRPGWSAYIVCISQGAYVKLGWGRVCEIVGLNFSNTFRCGSETWSCHRNTSDARNSQTHALIIAIQATFLCIYQLHIYCQLHCTLLAGIADLAGENILVFK